MRDKQIEEMARVIEKMPWRIEQDGLGCRITNNTELAEYFYNAGYRKASDVAREIFRDIYRSLNFYNPYRELNNIVYNVFGILEEVEKKYESEGEG